MQSKLASLLFISISIFILAACGAPEPPPEPTETPRATRTARPTSTATTTTAGVSVLPTATITTTRSVTTTSVALAPTKAGGATTAATTTATRAPNTLTSTPLPTETLVPAPIFATTPGPTPTPTMLGDCAEIWQSGYYTMYADFKTKLKRFDCIIVQASDVVIDCAGHTIEGLDRQGHGFWIRKYGFPFLQTPNNIEIKNCRIKNARDGIFAEAGTNIYIHDNDVSDNYDDTDKQRYGIFLGMTEGGGIRLDYVQNARIENNIANNSAIGIDIRNSESVLIRNNTINANSAWGVNLLNTTKTQVLNNTLKDNVRWCTWGNGIVDRGCDAAAVILQDGASNNVVRNNTIVGENANGIFIKAHGVRCGDNNRIEGNKITDVIYNAVEFSFCKGNQIIGNEISGSSTDGIWFGFSTDTQVRNNIIRNMSNHGIISYNSRGSIIADNQVINSREGIHFYWDDKYKQDKRFNFLAPSPDNYASRDNTITGNTLKDNSVAGIHLLNSIQNRVSGNTYAGNGRTIWVEGKSDGNSISALGCDADCSLVTRLFPFSR